MERLLTPFGEKLNKNLPLNDYPRPQLVRDNWQNLNGRWKYAIRKKEEILGEYDGEIIVPFSPETILSGVEKQVTPNDVLYYQRKFDCERTNKRVLLHFGAVDYACVVSLNGQEVGYHKGGYTPFTFDVTDYLKDKKNVLEVAVTDPTDTGAQARGKQSSKRGGIWYTPQSGIWQTVWLEQVADNYIKSFTLTPDIDSECVDLAFQFSDKCEPVTVVITAKGKKVAQKSCQRGKMTIPVDDPILWSPEQPFLYDMEVTLASGDTFTSYFGMRKFGIGKDAAGVSRLFLNNKPYFHNGLLDQGYWSDGMYTAPSDEALIYDIQTMKDMGFNMLRKHIKIEPLRWYYHCDRLGMLVWQDMVSGGGIYSPKVMAIYPAVNLALCKKVLNISDGEKNYKLFARDDEAGREEYYRDSEEMIRHLYNVVSLSVWVPFNEGWGQFDAIKAAKFYRHLDPTRIIDHASGFHDQKGVDLNSFHIYFTPFRFPRAYAGDDRPIVLSEFGGFSLQKKGHMYNKEKFFGYRKYYDDEKYARAIERLFAKKVVPSIKKYGLSATVYTEVSDVEDECNGLLTYDRRVVKIPVERMKKINEGVKLS